MKTLGFAAEYSVEPATSNDEELHRVEFGREPTTAQHTREQLVVSPDGGKAWLGSFESGIGGLTRAFSTPDARTLLVIDNGRAYLIPVDRPEKYVRPPINPVLEALPFPKDERLVLVSHTRLVGVGPKGIVWTTDDLASDGFDEIRSLSDGVYVSARLPSGDRAEYVVALKDGGLR